MSSLNEIYIKKDTLVTILNVLQAKGENGISITISINDEAKEFAGKEGKTVYQNVTAWVTQSKEQREAKKDKFYVGNGKTFYENGAVKVWGEKQKASPKVEYAQVIDETDDLPF